MMEFAKVEKLGEGTFGVVHKVVKKDEIFAMKKFRIFDNEGIMANNLRELTTIQELVHSNVVRLYEVYSDQDREYAIYEYVESDLYKLFKSHDPWNNPIPLDIIRQIMWDILSGIAYIHSHGIIHRDLKSPNILYGNGVAKIADFGGSRYEERGRKYTKNVITPFWRPPELFYGNKLYNEKVDMWSIGCIFGELFTLKPIFETNSDIDILTKIFSILGSPSDPNWKGNIIQGKGLEHIFPSEALSLAYGLLEIDPSKRVSAIQALGDPFFDGIRTQMEHPPSKMELVTNRWNSYKVRDWSAFQKDDKNYQITLKMRMILFNWFLELRAEWKYSFNTTFHAMVISDSFLGKVKTTRQNLQLIGVTAMLIAARMSEVVVQDVSAHSYMTDNTYSVLEITEKMKDILNVLSWYVPPLSIEEHLGSKNSIKNLFNLYISENGFNYNFSQLLEAAELGENIPEVVR